MLKTHYRQWVAYHGEDRIRFGRTQFELYEECYRRGWHDDEFVVRSVEPEMPDEIDPAELINQLGDGFKLCGLPPPTKSSHEHEIRVLSPHRLVARLPQGRNIPRLRDLTQTSLMGVQQGVPQGIRKKAASPRNEKTPEKPGFS